MQKHATKNKIKHLDPAAVFYVSSVSTVNALASEGDYHEWSRFSSVMSRILVPEYVKNNYD